MSGSPTGLRAERVKRRQAPERGRLRRERVTTVVEHDRETWALYLLARDFYGMPVGDGLESRRVLANTWMRVRRRPRAD
jgi:hypothetical protein